MDKIFLIIITLIAIFYIYYTISKNKGCNCGKKNCGIKKDKNNKDIIH
ncbi:FeoB-associated Cys-rich membrane protein [Malaciobacter halophilus]|uniref:FeoB-associated Cys-rich membrane protein n=1 Tax=Malaciobacter halophilus TaxID=197482 RepID=A0A2N1J4S2_9BACT|nr:FeoB-associated Cys-rich membrane protein [Malaciobacter halophilus]PKI81557.1 FeoB-associated Cys-rich membrane protein [Malaciobacter halophilus]